MAQKDLITMASEAPLAVLVELSNVLPRMIATKRAEGEATLRDEIEALARERGFNARDLFGGVSQQSGKRKYTRRGEGEAREPAAAKYRHPDEPEQTWSGRGRRAVWVNEYLDANPDKTLDDLLINE